MLQSHLIPYKTFNNSIPKLYNIGCVGKITSLNESKDGRYLIVLNGLSRFKILNEMGKHQTFLSISSVILPSNNRIVR